MIMVTVSHVKFFEQFFFYHTVCSVLDCSFDKKTRTAQTVRVTAHSTGADKA